jgi:hypothetical protein
LARIGGHMYDERDRERRQLAGVGGLFPGHQDVAGYLGRETGVLTRISRITRMGMPGAVERIGG